MMIKTDGLPRLPDYAAALRHWNEVVPIRGHESSEWKPVGRRSKWSHMRMRKAGDGTIVIRLYHTDVIEYHPDGSMSFEGYESVSTQQFVNAICPSGITPVYMQSVGYCLGLARRELDNVRHYENMHFFLMDRGKLSIERRGDRAEWYPIGDTPQFETIVLDKELTRAALKKYPRYRDICDWAKAAIALEAGSTIGRLSWEHLSPSDVVEKMNAGQWMELARNRNVGLSNMAEKVRRAIYVLECVDTCSTYQPYVVGWLGLKSVGASHKRHSWLRYWR
jgi:hypothetical protein